MEMKLLGKAESCIAYLSFSNGPRGVQKIVMGGLWDGCATGHGNIINYIILRSYTRLFIVSVG
jgi:hypothetical protein